MARKKGARTAKPKSVAKAIVAEANAPARRDIRPYVYLAFNQAFAVIYTYILIAAIPNRLPSGAAHLWALPVLMQVLSFGMATRFLRSPQLRRIGWWIVNLACALLVALTILLIVRVLISAAFLSGVYGAFGKAAAMSALIGVAIIVELVGLLPLFQLKYMRSRAGRREYTLA